MARGAHGLERQSVTAGSRGSKLPRMRFKVGKGTSVHVALVLGALAWAAGPQVSYGDAAHAPGLFASETVTPKSEPKPKERPRGTMPKCPEGGERVPEKRSPYDSIAPLSPLVA
jgi:hypothetical protein